VSASRATFHGRRRARAKTSAPNRIRSVRVATAPSSTHGSHVSMEPIAIASQVKKPSQPCSSAATAMSSS